MASLIQICTRDNRPHFEVLGEKYKNEDPSSEEELWIPAEVKNLLLGKASFVLSLWPVYLSMKKHHLISCLIFLATIKVFAQGGDSLKINAGTTFTAATKDYQPFWIISNRYGVIADKNVDLSTHLRLENKHIFPNNASFGKYFYINYALDLYNNNTFRDLFLKEGYVKAGYNSWEIRGGRYTETIGELDPMLSSGSFSISGNALPIPKVGIAVTRYTDIPFTKGWLQFKGQFIHGWMEKNRFVKKPYLHEKSLYLKLGKEKVNLQAGLTHFAQWAGEHPKGEAPDRFKDYLRIIRGASGDASDPSHTQGPVDIANAVGNHIIISDFALAVKIKGADFKLYTQTIFDKGKGDSSNTNKRDELVFLNAFGPDRMIGVSWKNPTISCLQKVVVEGIFTKNQGGDIIYNGRYNYYNNGTYQTGWQHHNRIVGTPLFINKSAASNYDSNKDLNTGGWNVVSNRIVGFHIGFKGKVAKKINYRALVTTVKHYGNYYNDKAFSPGRRQNHLLFESSYLLTKSLAITAGIAQDFGDLSDNTGGLLKIEWSLIR